MLDVSSPLCSANGRAFVYLFEYGTWPHGIIVVAKLELAATAKFTAATFMLSWHGVNIDVHCFHNS